MNMPLPLAPSDFALAITEDNFDTYELVIAGRRRLARTHRAGHAEEFRSMDYTEEFGTDEFFEMNAVNGVLYFGVSPPGIRSPFDEHAWFEGAANKYVPRVDKESCISLTAQSLSSRTREGDQVIPITHFPEIDREIKYLTYTDLNPVENDDHFMESFPYAVKAMHGLLPDEPQLVRQWLRDGMNVKRDNEWGSDNFTFPHAYVLMAQTTEFARKGLQWRRDWLELGLEALERDQRQFVSARDMLKAQRDDISIVLKSPAGQRIRLGMIESDNERVGSAARYLGIHILLQITSDGHKQLYTDYRVNGGQGIDLKSVACRIQLAEQEAQVRAGVLSEIITDDPDILCREGFPFWGSVWYHVYGMLLNGSKTRMHVPPSLLEARDTFAEVQLGLFEGGYEVVDD